MRKVRFIIPITAMIFCWLRVADSSLGLGGTLSGRSRKRDSHVPDRLVRPALRRPSYYASNWTKPIRSSKSSYLHYHTKSLKSLRARSQH